MQLIPLIAVPDQTLQVVLNGQLVGVRVYALNNAGAILGAIPGATADSTLITADNTQITADATTGSALELAPSQYLYMDVTLAGVPLITGKLCAALSPIFLTSPYVGFDGELEFFDTVNISNDTVTNPEYTGLGTQYQLVYFSPADLAAGLGATYP